jgi:hypothetical protein
MVVLGEFCRDDFMAATLTSIRRVTVKCRSVIEISMRCSQNALIGCGIYVCCSPDAVRDSLVHALGINFSTRIRTIPQAVWQDSLRDVINMGRRTVTVVLFHSAVSVGRVAIFV